MTDRYDELYAVYETVDAETIRAYQDLVDLYPPLDSSVALSYWEDASETLAEKRADVADRYGEGVADLVARASRDQAFTALDLYTSYGRGVNVLVLDVDETLRSAGHTDNEIPREVLHLLTEFHEAGVPIVICTGQTLENVKGFLIQGLGNELVHSGDLSVVYETGTGVFTPGHGPETKRLLYEDLDDDVTEVFAEVRARVLSDAPGDIRSGCHLQGNEFNVTLKPNHETGTERAVDVVAHALRWLLSLLGDAVSDANEREVKAYYAAQDPEIAAVLDAADDRPDVSVPDAVAARLERIDVAYYEGDAAEIASRELNKVVGVTAALDVLGVDDPFALVMGDSKSDRRVMEWAAANDAGIAAAPAHASAGVRDFVEARDDLVFDSGRAGDVLRTTYALNRLAARADEN
ncbi:HAD family hydrolase [Halocalculus aciditolerans]|uniref:Haloacid dehalogenase n=1 Tax=Halocalculus aciditolerans TaxID=1383812 RepID=A0A830FJH1_9EURY|nr:HAD family hydrolase [Halocalculus aciditolerans]GGL62403.1 haloacid dehalogenase [Halocalculus aciditolerans]